MVSAILSRVVILVFGTLYPAYASYKAVRTKNVKEYVKWMMYWIVFALFTCVETFTDIFLSWFPFYYGIKIILVIWLLSPATKGSSILYRKFVHPTLSSREQEIDEYITKAKEQSYRQVLDLGSKGVSALMQTAIKGGGGIVNQLKKSYSLSDLSDPSHDDVRDETDDIVTDPRLRRRRSPHRSSSSTSAVFFSEVDIRSDRISSIQSAEDISSGYSSGEGLYPGQPPKLTGREPLHRAGSLTRSRTTRVTRSSVPRKAAGSDDSDDNEVFDTNIIFHNENSKISDDKAESSSSETEFLDSLDTMHENLGEDRPNANQSLSVTACMESLDPSSLTHSTSDSPIIPSKSDLHLLQITKDVDSFSEFLQGLIETRNEKFEDSISTPIPHEDGKEKTLSSTEQDSNLKNPLECPIKPIQHDKCQVLELPEALGSKSNTLAKPDSKLSLSESNSGLINNGNIVETSGRGGRYNKKIAPTPPTYKQEAGAPIKATLVLQPGLFKTVSSEDIPCKEIFIQSPKSKRRSIVNRSPSSISFSKLIKLPKKIGFWNKEVLDIPKNKDHRLSWHGVFSSESNRFRDLNTLSDSKIQSKSYNNLSKESTMMLHGSNMARSSSQMSIESLTDSPSAPRRLRVIKNYVDEDVN